MTSSSLRTAVAARPSLPEYAAVCMVLAGVVLWLWVALREGAGVAIESRRLVAPMVALVALTGVVALSMVLVRNISVATRRASVRYYADYETDPPPAWVERPASIFNNLTQVPPLFYVVCLLLMQVGEVDRADLLLAWTFVATRAVHALIYVVWNHVPLRFAAWLAGCLTLAVMWARLA